MAKIQYPIDGKLGKDYQVTSPFGWRVHPISKKKKHHNGVDLWSAKEPCYIEAFADGEVLEARASTSADGGFGHYVKMLHKIDGEWYVSIYAHMIAGSIKVKAGQKIEAGTVVGKMGATGYATGKHLHFEIYKGKKYAYSPTGENFVEPMPFIAALIAKEAVLSQAPLATPNDAPVQPAPVHGPNNNVIKYKVKRGDTLTLIAKKHKTTVSMLLQINNIKNPNLIQVGQVLTIG